MSTQSLTDQLRLLEEEIIALIKRPYGCVKLHRPCLALLAVAKGLEGRLNEVTSASTQQHLAAADRTSSELAALRAENEDLESRLGEIERSHECRGDGCEVCYALTRDPRLPIQMNP